MRQQGSTNDLGQFVEDERNEARRDVLVSGLRLSTVLLAA